MMKTGDSLDLLKVVDSMVLAYTVDGLMGEDELLLLKTIVESMVVTHSDDGTMGDVASLLVVEVVGCLMLSETVGSMRRLIVVDGLVLMNVNCVLVLLEAVAHL